MSFHLRVMMILKPKKLSQNLFQLRKEKLFLMTLVRQRKKNQRMLGNNILTWIKFVSLGLLMIRRLLMLPRKARRNQFQNRSARRRARLLPLIFL
ncbi:hypothetical protein G4B88_031556 [Cannabis sativa]|uniref:Uncharacterized protein n=1 Tax=Cannabis sativa TaxID=3483 RepID=A0A7J6EX79_CANSA|nr:hypothetical protein G4B88_031556 [Cannabis sativa]